MKQPEENNKITPTPRGTRVIGITGGMASGKSTVAAMFHDLPRVDADALVHHLMSEDAEVIAAIAAAFPESVTPSHDGVCAPKEKSRHTPHINRAALAALITQHPAALVTLEQILHPRVRAREIAAIAAAREAGEKAILLDIPLLFETDAQELCDAVIVVHAPEEIRRERAFARPGMTEEKWRRLLNRQLPDHARLERAHHVIHTATSIDETRAQVMALMKEWGLL